MSYSLTEEQQLIRQNAKEFAQEYIAPIAGEIDNTGVYPKDVVQKMAEHDFLGMFLPAEYSGLDAGYLSFVLIVEEISRVSGAVASILINHAALAALAINRYATEEQKGKYLPDLCSGKKLGSFALTEKGAAPGMGKDKLVAVKDGGNYILNGEKCYIANGGVAGTYVVIAQTNAAEGIKGLSAFIVDGSAPGLSVKRTIAKMGLRGAPSAELKFEDVKVPCENLLGEEGKGFLIAGEVQAVADVALGALIVGIAQEAMLDAAKYSQQRIQFHRPIGSFPAIQTMLAEMAANIHLARLAIYDAASLIENDEPYKTEAAMIKLFANRIGQSALIDVIQIEGGYGYSQEMIASRLYRDVKGGIIKDNSADFPEKVIAESLFS